MDSIFSTFERILAAAGLLVFAAGCLLVRFFNPSTAGFFPGCPLLEMTGFACPGCGLTRGFHSLFHGDLLGALDFNALLPFFAVSFVYMVILLVSIAMRGKPLSFTIFTPASLWAFLGFAAVFFVLRNVPGYPFEILFP